MSFHVSRVENELDYITDAARLCDRVPSFVDFFDALQELRDAHWEARQIIAGRERAGLSLGGSMMRVACIPPNVLMAIRAIEPNFTKDTKLFYKWLSRHKEYQVGHIKFQG